MRLWLCFIALIMILIWSCRSEIPFDQGWSEPNPLDTTGMNKGDTSVVDPKDTTGMTGDTTSIDTILSSCDTSIIYFETDILPILIGNCALAGCHDPISSQHELVLTSYEALKEHDDIVVPFDPDKSDLYEKITEDKPSERMPPAPNEALTPNQILKIQKWILQGAEDNSCNSAGNAACDTAMVSYASDVKPIFENYCITCHGSADPNGGVSLTTHNGASAIAKSGKLRGVVSWANGFLMMPLGGDQIPECDINTISAWINQGTKNN